MSLREYKKLTEEMHAYDLFQLEKQEYTAVGAELSRIESDISTCESLRQVDISNLSITNLRWRTQEFDVKSLNINRGITNPLNSLWHGYSLRLGEAADRLSTAAVMIRQKATP